MTSNKQTALVANFKKLLPDYTPEDVIGSPYAPTNYTCNPTLCPNGDEDLVWLRKKLNDMGLYLMLDFVPNHGACDSEWMQGDGINLYVRAPSGVSNPKRYMANGVAYGSCDPNGDSWTDTAQFNYWNPATRALLLKQIKRVASLADAIRCDMAYIDMNDYFENTWKTELSAWGWKKPATEFWADAIAAIKAEYPNTIMLAEVYGDWFTALQDVGFDYTYDKEYLDRLKSGHMDNIRAWLDWTEPRMGKMCYFIENHDEDRAMSVFGNNAVRTAGSAVMALTLPGMRLFFQDQEHGYANKLDVHLRRARDEAPNAMLETFYANLSTILHNDVLNNGVWDRVTINGDDAWRFVAWRYHVDRNEHGILVVINYSAEPGGCQTVLPDAAGNGNVAIQELFSLEQYSRSAPDMRTTGLPVYMNGYTAQIFSYPRV